ncbi:hypothetical protein Rsub_05020 [Raphidocelis subcapitata]|uniref:Uncharacterized protein n=1 Tax=Raphidocelis subcapitata TaxID=307507 RepID=A0A2V0NYE1_9CHLO|nr:hypothetical protein Rsub_05020 [Raphidocelis subcapitata]|eukprot:GBF92651.1 hypothetical protein Rsub_05020 [Raphidocelis subcapitata]
MGKRSRSPSPSDSSSSGERRHKKHKHKEKEKHKHKDKHKKSKHKSKRERRSSSPDAGRLAAAKAYLQQVLAQGGGGDAAAAAAAAVFAAEAAAGKGGGGGGGGPDKEERRRQREQQKRAPRPKPPGVADISGDDYFSKAPEFTAWLQEERGCYFNSLSGEAARALFGEFVDTWNSGHLAPKYYQALVAAPLKRTAHTWGFAAKPKAGGGGGVAALMSDQQQQRQEAHAAAREETGKERRKWRSEQNELLDELLPKATGREAVVEKRIARREAARARDNSPELMRVTGGGDVMGGDDSFAAAKAREAAFSARRTQRDAAKREGLMTKLQAAAAEEAAKMAAFRAMVSAGPITIPKRAPPQ